MNVRCPYCNQLSRHGHAPTCPLLGRYWSRRDPEASEPAHGDSGRHGGSHTPVSGRPVWHPDYGDGA